MKKQETSTTDKGFEVEYTEADIQEMRENGYSEDELPSVRKHVFRRARHIVSRKEQKLKVTIMLDADVLDFYKEQAAKAGNLPYQTQINRQLRKAMEKAQNPNSQVVTMEMLENPAFLAELANRLKKAA
ncbi:MAG: BrnA antitoxin family protein [Pyrinomonadaceae bacterium]